MLAATSTFSRWLGIFWKHLDLDYVKLISRETRAIFLTQRKISCYACLGIWLCLQDADRFWFCNKALTLPNSVVFNRYSFMWELSFFFPTFVICFSLLLFSCFTVTSLSHQWSALFLKIVVCYCRSLCSFVLLFASRNTDANTPKVLKVLNSHSLCPKLE